MKCTSSPYHMRTVTDTETVQTLQFHQHEHKIRRYVKGVEAEFKYSKGRYRKMVSCQSRPNTVLFMNQIILQTCSTEKKTSEGVRKLQKVHYLFIVHSIKKVTKESQQTFPTQSPSLVMNCFLQEVYLFIARKL